MPMGTALAKEIRKREPDLSILLTTGFVDAPERIAERATRHWPSPTATTSSAKLWTC